MTNQRIRLYSTKDITLATVLVYLGNWLVSVRVEVKSLQPLRTEATFVMGVTSDDIERLLHLYGNGDLSVEPRQYDAAKAEVVTRMRLARRNAIKEAMRNEQD